MKDIREFINKAIEGGWLYQGKHTIERVCLAGDDEQEQDKLGYYFLDIKDGGSSTLFKETILLDPKAWQAVGKVEGWKQMNYGFTLRNHIGNREYTNAGAGEWQYKMHEMIDALCEGKSIEDYIKTL